MRREYVIAILLAVSAVPLGAALMVAPDYLHLAGYLVPFTFWGGISLAILLIVTAGAIAGRGERSAHSSAISYRSHESRNVLLSEAIWRAHVGRWDDLPDYGNDDTARESFENTTAQVRQFARDGKLPVWGTKRRGSTFDPIPVSFWSTHDIQAGYAINPLVRDTFVYVTEPTEVGQTRFARTQDWSNFMTSRQVVEELWPGGPS